MCVKTSPWMSVDMLDKEEAKERRNIERKTETRFLSSRIFSLLSEEINQLNHGNLPE